MKVNKMIKRIFNLYNMAILGCTVIILISIYIIFKPEKKEETNNIETVQSKNEEITEEEARTIAKKQFKKLGEKNIQKDKLQVKKIQRNGEEYYYISSAENTLEIQIRSGKITRINSKVL